MPRVELRPSALPACWLVWALLAGWSLPAAAATFGQGMRSYDLESIGWAMGVACLGGVASTLVKLRNARVLVRATLVEALWDCGIAAIAGAITYVLLSAWGAMRSPVPDDVTVGALALAGFARGAFFIWFTSAGRRLGDRAVDAAVAAFPQPAPAAADPDSAPKP